MSNYHIKSLKEYFHVYEKSVNAPKEFWEEVAEEHFIWRKRWNQVLSWDFSIPEVKWFQGAQLNITENCIDRHLTAKGNKTAILFEPNDPKYGWDGAFKGQLCNAGVFIYYAEILMKDGRLERFKGDITISK